MKPPRNRPGPPGRKPPPTGGGKPVREAATAPAGGKLWVFRLVLALGAPATLFVLVEVGLRLAGFGYPTGFLLTSSNGGARTFIQNNQFGWRFFGPRMSRTPQPISISQTKAPGVVRVFVFGESAAQGDPQPQFGLARMLEAMLGLKHPGTRFEVVNAAMTAINSHTILPIARDCARADGDLWVLYIGNNEVVGPFGAGTVFGPKAAALPLIRANLALRSTRTGQWLDSLRQSWGKKPRDDDEWGGMEMFLDQQVGADNPLLNTVYDNFARNLADIIQTGHRAGAGVVVGTVAVNLKDSAPFASIHRPGLADPDKARWEQVYRAGVAAQDAGRNDEAATQFQAAAGIDDRFANLRFCQGRCALALGQTSEAQRHFRAARDLDGLRFRCDTRLNDLIRHAASGREGDRVLLADVEKTFEKESPNGLPGAELFYEHVHLTFEGNYLLARTVAAQLETLMPKTVKGGATASQDWPSIQGCARRLAWTDYYRRAGLSEILGRVGSAPFTGQMNHEETTRDLRAMVDRLGPAGASTGLAEARRASELALRENPDDPRILAQLAAARQSSGDLEGAAVAARRALELLPSSGGEWAQLGLILAQQNQFEEAAASFRRAFAMDPQDVWALRNLAQALDKLGRHDAAALEYRRAVAIKPRFGSAWLGLGQTLEEMGRKTEAEECYHKALANPVHYAPELALLARFCRNRSWLKDAATNYEAAIRLNPADAALHFELGQDLEALGRRAEAGSHYAEAVRLAPGMGEARFLWGIILGQEGRASAAEEQFRASVELLPNLLETRINLGIALLQEGRRSEAREQFEEVLRRSPTNEVALRQIQKLGAASPGAR